MSDVITKGEKRFLDLTSALLGVQRRPPTRKQLAFVRELDKTCRAAAAKEGIELRDDIDEPADETAVD